MKAIDFTDGWSYRHLPSDTHDAEPLVPVAIPHDAMLGEPRTPDAPGAKNSGWFVGRDYEYVKTFVPDEALAAATVVLEFEGVYHRSEIRLDGELLAARPNGYVDITVDLTGRLVAGRTHQLQVIARNSAQPNSRWYSGAGIYRPVVLWTAPAAHIPLDGLTVRTLSLEPPTIEVLVTPRGDGELTIDIADERTGASRARTVVAASDGVESCTVIELPDAPLWSPDNPALHRCSVELASESAVDRAEASFGIRTVSWGDEGLLLNGQRIILQGACIHHDNGLLGARADADAEDRKVRLLQEAGYNALRSAHNPCSKALLEACDRRGMLVMDEYVDHWYIHKTRYDYADDFAQWWPQDLRDMVVKDRNHPSVIMYSIGNEVGETSQEKGIEYTRLMTEHLHELDPTRPVTCGINIFFNFLTSIGFGVYSDKKAAKEAEKPKGRTKAVGSEFFNNVAGLLGAGFMKWGATLHGSDVKTRDAFARLDIAGYNYGIRRYEKDLRKYPARLILGTETFVFDAYRFRELAERNPRIIGDFVWAGMDHIGEVGIGAWEYREYAPEFDGFGWLTSGQGRIDITGKPLGDSLYTRVALKQADGPFLAVAPVESSGEKHSPSAWRSSNARATWSWNGCEGRTAQVEVYARAASVELRLNGRVVGSERFRDDCIARLECPWEPGVLEAVTFDDRGRETGRCQLRSAGEETELRAEPESEAVGPGRLAYVRLRYTDAAGELKPRERGILRVSVEGGELAGLGSAAPFNLRGYTGTETDTYYGEAMAIVRAGSADEVVLEVTDGERSGRIVIPVRSDAAGETR